MPTIQRMKTKVALIGDAGVGKTSLIRRFVLDEFDDKYLHTVGTKVTKVHLTIPHGVDTEIEMDMSIFDIMGQKGFRDMVRETYFHDVQGIVAVCDLTVRDSLENLQDWIATALESGGDATVYILANKRDLLDKAAFGDDALRKLAQPWNATFLYTSAKSGDHVDDAFNALAIEAVNNAMRLVKSHEVSADLDDRVLLALSQRGFLGLTKGEMFQKFRGIEFDDLKVTLERLEREQLIQLNWRNESEFTAMITSKGMTEVRGQENQGTRLSTV